MLSAEELIDALDLPGGCRIDRRVPKTLFLEHGSATPADKRRINDGVEQVEWVAALKPTTVGIAAYVDDSREYLEIAVLRFTLRAKATVSRLVELCHRAIPYPVMALTVQERRVNVSLAHKRWSLGEAGKTVLDSDLIAIDWEDADEAHRAAFLAALGLARQPRANLFALYQDWIDTLLGLLVARHTGIFTLADTLERSVSRREALAEFGRLDIEMARLRGAAKRERQVARQVDMNLELKRVQAARAAAFAKL